MKLLQNVSQRMYLAIPLFEHELRRFSPSLQASRPAFKKLGLTILPSKNFYHAINTHAKESRVNFNGVYCFEGPFHRSFSRNIGFTELTASFRLIQNRGDGIRSRTNLFERGLHDVANEQKTAEGSNSDGKKGSEKKDGAIARIKGIINSFWLGCKQLMWIDARKAWATKKKLKSNNYDLTFLTREDLRHMRQTKKDIFKSLPMALLFFLPFIGYFAPLIGFLFPKKFLSHQFWNTEQMKKFAFEDHAKRSQYYLPLIQELGWSSKELKDQELLKLCMKAIDKSKIENDELLAMKGVFDKDLMTVEGMPRFHLEKLCKTWLLPVKWYIPGKILREYLPYRIKQIIEDDAAIRREGTAVLTDKCIRQACHARGLDKYSFDIPVMKEWLEDWINLTTNLTDNNLSFMAHCAAFKTINFGRDIEEKLSKNNVTKGASITDQEITK